jgi:flagellin
LDQLVEEVGKVANTIDFNGVKLLDGSMKPVILQVGAREGETIALNIVDSRPRSLGLEGYRPDGQLLTGRVGNLSGLLVGDVLLNGEPAISTGRAPSTSTAAALAEAINTNTDIHGVIAEAYNTLNGVAPLKTTFAEGEVVINGISVGAAASLDELVRNINRFVPGLSAVIGDDGALELSNSTGEDIVIGKVDASGVLLSTYESGSPAGAGLTTGIYRGFLELNSISREIITVSAGTGKTTADVQKFGLNATSNGTTFSGVAPTVTTEIGTTDKILINGVEVPVSASGSIADKVLAINSITAKTGVTAAAPSPGAIITLTSTLGTRIVLESPTNSLNKLGLIAQGGSDVLVSKALSIVTQDFASRALTTIDDGIQNLLVSRASLGAFQNRLTATIDNLSVNSSSLTQSRSRLVDADYAAATTELARAQIIQQASTAILAQANADQQTVLKLLQ